MRIFPPARSVMSTVQRSSGNGWQKGTISWVFFAAMTPATMAVSNTGPFFVRWPVRLSARATAGGSLTVASALASRKLALLAPTSTMVGRLAASRWVSFGMVVVSGLAAANLTTNIVHFDLVQVGCVPKGRAQL